MGLKFSRIWVPGGQTPKSPSREDFFIFRTKPRREPTTAQEIKSRKRKVDKLIEIYSPRIKINKTQLSVQFQKYFR